MSAKGYIFTNWSPRKEAVESCSARLAECLQSLEETSTAFTSWLDARRKSNIPIGLGSAELARLLNAGRNKTEVLPRKIIDELGFSVGLEGNGGKPGGLTLRLLCGAYAKEVLNRCSIDFPGTGDNSYGVVASDIKIRALQVLIKSWDPEWGAICNWPLYHAIQSKGIQIRLLSYIGSVVYVSRRRGELPDDLIKRFRTQNFEPFGSLIYVNENSEKEENVECAKAALDIYQCLERNGFYHEFPA